MWASLPLAWVFSAVLQIDQVIGAIGKPDLPLPLIGPRRGRIGQRCHLWRGGRVAGRHVVIGILGLCRLGRCLIKRREVFARRPGELLRLRPGCELAVDLAAGAGVCLDHSDVDGKALAADQSSPHAARHHLFEEAAEQGTLAKAAMPVLVRCVARHPRWTFHFTPTSASWLNAAEGFFARLTRRRLQRGVFHSLVDLQAAINRFLTDHNQSPKPFVWTADPNTIIAAANRGYQVLDSIH
jgi:hypothetical protein